MFAPGVLTSDGLTRIGSAFKEKVEDWAGSHRLTVLLVTNGKKLEHWGAVGQAHLSLRRAGGRGSPQTQPGLRQVRRETVQ